MVLRGFQRFRFPECARGERAGKICVRSTRVSSYSSHCPHRSIFSKWESAEGVLNIHMGEGSYPLPPTPPPPHPYLPSVRPSLSRAQLHFGEFSRAVLLSSCTPHTQTHTHTHRVTHCSNNATLPVFLQKGKNLELSTQV